jgi:hypothetical protein
LKIQYNINAMKPIKVKADIYEILQAIEDDGDLWHRDAIAGPNWKTLSDASDIFGKLSDDHGILPQRLVQTVEEGLYVEFVGFSHRVVMELYNRGDAAILILDGKTSDIVESIDIPSFGRVGSICVAIPKILAS